MRKILIISIVALLLLVLTILVSSTGGNSKLAPVFVWNNTAYHKSYDEVITDERIIHERVGKVKRKMLRMFYGNRLLRNGEASILKPGTEIYSIKGIDKVEALAVKENETWELYRAMGSSGYISRLYTEDMLNSEKVVVSSLNNSDRGEIREITDKQIIKSLADGLKNAGAMSIHSGGSSNYTYAFYFYSKGEDGIGKIAYKYVLRFQDIALEGSIFAAGAYYKLNSDFLKLISSPFGVTNSAYDVGLGGKLQINTVSFFSPKYVFKGLAKNMDNNRFEIKILNQGDQIWENGLRVDDNLQGKFKIEVTMRDTKVQKKVIDDCTQNLSKIKGATSIRFTQGESRDTTVMYISFDTKPDFKGDQSSDSLILLINP
jgi:hypothetical protein